MEIGRGCKAALPSHSRAKTVVEPISKVGQYTSAKDEARPALVRLRRGESSMEWACNRGAGAKYAIGGVGRRERLELEA